MKDLMVSLHVEGVTLIVKLSIENGFAMQEA